MLSLCSLGKVTQADAEGFVFNFDVVVSPALDARALPARFAVTVPPTWPARAPQAVLVSAGSQKRDTYGALAIGKPVSCPQATRLIFHNVALRSFKDEPLSSSAKNMLGMSREGR